MELELDSYFSISQPISYRYKVTSNSFSFDCCYCKLFSTLKHIHVLLFLNDNYYIHKTDSATNVNLCKVQNYLGTWLLCRWKYIILLLFYKQEIFRTPFLRYYIYILITSVGASVTWVLNHQNNICMDLGNNWIFSKKSSLA